MSSEPTIKNPVKVEFNYELTVTTEYRGEVVISLSDSDMNTLVRNGKLPDKIVRQYIEDMIEEGEFDHTADGDEIDSTLDEDEITTICKVEIIKEEPVPEYVDPNQTTLL